MAFTPTTWDPATLGAGALLSGGDLVYAAGSAVPTACWSVASATSDKWYWELTIVQYPAGSSGKLGAWAGAGESELALTDAASMGGWAPGDVLGFLLDIGNNSIEFFKNGAYTHNGWNIPPVSLGKVWRPYVALVAPEAGTALVSANFGNAPFSHMPTDSGAYPGFGDDPEPATFEPAAWDPAQTGSAATLSNGNRTYSTENYYSNTTKADVGLLTGQWYWELEILATAPGTTFSTGVTSADLYDGWADSYSLDQDTAPATGVVLGHALDLDAGTLQVYVDGVLKVTKTGVFAEPYGGFPRRIRPSLRASANSGVFSVGANFGQAPFVHAPPAGYFAGYGRGGGGAPAEGAVTGIEAPGIGVLVVTQAAPPLGFEPTAWNPLTMGSDVSLSGAGLVYSATGGASNLALTVAGVSTGKWYWELTLDEMRTTTIVGVMDAGGGDSGALYLQPYYNIPPGGTVGLTLDADARLLYVYHEGVNIDASPLGGEEHAPPPGIDDWYRPIIQMQGGAPGAPAVATANFGASPFFYPVPAGFKAGFGALPGGTQVAGIEAAGAGDPFIDPRTRVLEGLQADGCGTPAYDTATRVTGIEAGGAGTPGRFQRGVVPGIQSAGAGQPVYPRPVEVQVYGIDAPGAGDPRLAIPAPPAPLPRFRTAGIEAPGAGGPSVSAAISTPLGGLQSPGPGAPSLTVGCCVQWAEPPAGAGVGTVTASCSVAPCESALGCGGVTAFQAVLVAGLQAPGAGIPVFFGESINPIGGIQAQGAGGVLSLHFSVRVAPMALPPGAGTPFLSALPC